MSFVYSGPKNSFTLQFPGLMPQFFDGFTLLMTANFAHSVVEHALYFFSEINRFDNVCVFLDIVKRSAAHKNVLCNISMVVNECP